MGWDPAFRTGCKIAIVDPTGKVLYTTVIFPTAPQNKIEESKKIILGLIDKYNVDLISLGNGTASRESEAVIVDIIKKLKEKFSILLLMKQELQYIQQANLQLRNSLILMLDKEVLHLWREDYRIHWLN